MASKIDGDMIFPGAPFFCGPWDSLTSAAAKQSIRQSEKKLEEIYLRE
tara:strand:+ start:401 stop:544 length:144 start_codon:yes stop_codon:yes gene_type:complete